MRAEDLLRERGLEEGWEVGLKNAQGLAQLQLSVAVGWLVGAIFGWWLRGWWLGGGVFGLARKARIEPDYGLRALVIKAPRCRRAVGCRL